MKAIEEFVKGKYGIGYIDSDFLEKVGAQEFETATFLGRLQTFARYMSDEEIESTLKPGICTLGDILALFESNDEKHKNGSGNIFYFPSCVVGVYWSSFDRGWHVRAWQRGVRVWRAGNRVFSPATDCAPQSSDSRASGPSELLPLELVVNGYIYRRVDGDGAPLP